MSTNLLQKSLRSWLYLLSLSNAAIITTISPSYAETSPVTNIALPQETETNDIPNISTTVNVDNVQVEPTQVSSQLEKNSADTPQITQRDRQADPNRDRFPQQVPNPTPLETEKPVETPTPQPQETVPNTDQTIQVEKINVTGSTVFKTKELNLIVEPLEGRKVTIAELNTVVDNITQLYLEKGYLTSRAILLEQTNQNGIVNIQIIEGTLPKIEVTGTTKLHHNYIRSRVSRGISTPLNTSNLEDHLRLLRTDPLFENVEASLKAGEKVGESILVVRVKEANPLTANLSVDNYSPPSIGSERLGLNVSYRNLTGLGDELSGTYYHTTTSGADSFDFNYRLPVNAMNGTLQLRAAPSSNRVTDSNFSALKISGDSQLYEISYRQPLVRTSREEFALSLGFSYQDGQTFTFAGPTPFGIGPDTNGNSKTRTLKFGQDYTRRDIYGAWSIRSLFSFGLDIFNPTINSDTIPDGRFFTWLGQVQRVQSFSPDNFLIFQLDTQLTPHGLLPSQQFVIGGGQSVRGYRQNTRAGDNGVRLSLENRQTIMRNESGVTTMQIAPHFDMGTIWNVSDNPNKLQSQTFLAGLGLGLIWQPAPKLNIRLDYTWPLVNLKDRGTNAQDDGFYFSVGYTP